jgi:hypothetical protein
MEAALVQPAERQQILKLAAVSGFGAFAFSMPMGSLSGKQRMVLRELDPNVRCG